MEYLRSPFKKMFVVSVLASSLLAGCYETGGNYKELANQEDENKAESAEEESGLTDELIGAATGLVVNAVVDKYLPTDSEMTDESISDTANTVIDVAGKLFSNESSNDQESFENVAKTLKPLSGNNGTKGEVTFYKAITTGVYDGDTTYARVQEAYTLKHGKVEQVSLNDEKYALASSEDGTEITIRYLLLNTNELKDKKTSKPQPFAEAARDFTKNQLGKSETIYIAYGKGERTDHYKRNLMYVILSNGELLQELIIQQGLGDVAYITEQNTTFLSQLQAAEARAKRQKLGIWE